MKITKVVDESGKGYTYHKVYIEHNGMGAYFCLEDSFSQRFSKEIEEFKKCFFDWGEESWQGVMDEEDVVNVFLDFALLHNDKVSNFLERRMLKEHENNLKSMEVEK